MQADGLSDFAMVTSPNETGVVVIGGSYAKCFEKPNYDGIYEYNTYSPAIFELDGKIMKWIRLDQNLEFGRYGHSAVQIPSNLTIKIDETANDDDDDDNDTIEKQIEKRIKDVKRLADDYYLEKNEHARCSPDDDFPHTKDCARFISGKLKISVALVTRILKSYIG